MSDNPIRFDTHSSRLMAVFAFYANLIRGSCEICKRKSVADCDNVYTFVSTKQQQNDNSQKHHWKQSSTHQQRQSR